ncbi:hypothetical protein PGTUg99_025314 [Puccinia graminis f. sp. tritici]|uniref:Uncharacterized protein n=1 Tax=Puccinia graminis f. sp. tritici TaxID=56615 RepID=A0A5B0S0F2_PUCGR|nr:hypothetical protein PGTUg99_025314 [Puccinia graminis f. sp. tritici]
MFRFISPPFSPLFCLEVHSSSVSHTPVPSCFPRCHPLSPPRTPRVTPPTPVGPGTPPAAPKQVSHRRFRLWSAPNPASAPRCSPLLVAPPQYTLNPRSAVGRDPRRPPMPGFPAPAYVASAPRAFRISAASIPHAPNKPAKALVQVRSRHHIPPTLKILSPGSSSPPTSIPVSHLPTMSTCSNCQSRNTTCVRESSNHAPDSHGRPRPPKRPRTTTRGNSLDDFVVPDSASVSVASPTPSSRPPSPPPQPPQSSPESPAGSDRMTPRPHESDFSSRHEYRAALRNWASRHHVTQPLYDERLRCPASSPRRGSPRHSPLCRSPRRISDSPVPPSAPAADLQVSPVIRSTPVSPMHVDPEPEILHPTPPPSVGAAPDHTTPNSSPPPLLNVLRTPRPAERGPSEVPEVVHSRAITPRPATNASLAASTRANPFPASRYFRLPNPRYPTDPNDPALRELFPDEANGVFDAIPADAVEAVLVDIQGRFETILSVSVLPPSLRRSNYADFLSEIRELRRHRLQVMAVFNPASPPTPMEMVTVLLPAPARPTSYSAAGVGCSEAPSSSSSSASEPLPDSESAAEASSPSSPAASDSSSEVPLCFGIFTTSSSSSVSAVSSKDVEPLA